MPIRRKVTKKKATKKRAVRKVAKKRAVRKVARRRGSASVPLVEGWGNDETGTKILISKEKSLGGGGSKVRLDLDLSSGRFAVSVFGPDLGGTSGDFWRDLADEGFNSLASDAVSLSDFEWRGGYVKLRTPQGGTLGTAQVKLSRGSVLARDPQELCVDLKLNVSSDWLETMQSVKFKIKVS